MATATEVPVKVGEEKRTYTALEIAQMLDISKSSAYELCKSGKFRTVKVGRTVRAVRKSFDHWLENNS